MEKRDEIRPCCCKQQQAVTRPCCSPETISAERFPNSARAIRSWIVGTVSSPAGPMPRVSTSLRLADYLGAWKVRWAIRRTDYRIDPGLYAVGTPTAESAVLVSANYKMSFDRLRSQLSGIDAWILVLDTQGVNVWCSAGKGTFGTDELVRRIEQLNVLEWVSHRTVIVPQLAAPGVAAHEVRKRTGVRVIYGPVRAEDLPEFLAAGMKPSPEMRRVRFPLWDRLVLIPVELVTTAKWTLSLAAMFLLLAGVGRDGYSVGRILEVGLPSAAVFLLTCLAGLVCGPALLPWLPGRAFSLKGFWIGLGMLLIFLIGGWVPIAPSSGWMNTLAWCLLLPAATSVLVLKFTGAATYTSLSGVRRETRIALPMQLSALVIGLSLWLVGRFL